MENAKLVNISINLKKQMERLAREKNIEIFDDESLLKERERIEKKTIDEAHQILRRKKVSAMEKMSIWSGEEVVEFEFKDWKPDKQNNAVLARNIAKQIYLLTQELKNEQYNVVLFGAPGVGKTSLAVAMLTELKESGQTTMVISTAELAAKLSDSYEYKSIKDELNYIEKALKECDVLLIDDFGTEGGIVSASRDAKPVRKDLQDYIYRISNARAGKKTTIITTNNTLPQLSEMYDVKTISRLIPKDKEHQVYFKGLEDVRSV